MIEAGIFDGDFVVARSQSTAEQGDIVVAGIPGEEATIKTYLRTEDGSVVLRPANERLSDLVYEPDEVSIYGRLVTVMRRL
jgi:repressor LexA